MKFLEVKPSLKRYFGNEGTFTDPRDGNVYKTVTINGQVWLAENLRFEGVEHYAPDGNEDNIPEYGCLYTWDNALEACPEGWHLPTEKEFEDLLKTAGDTDKERFKNLASQDWQDWRGNDKLGFRALPAGLYLDGSYSYFDYNAGFWSITEYEDITYYVYYLFLGNDNAIMYHSSKEAALSVRCIKD